MTTAMVQPDVLAVYETKEVAIILAALAFVIVLGGVALAAVVICGWRGAQNIAIDWLRGTATFVCRS